MRTADKTDKTDKKRRTGEQPPALLTLKNREPFPLILRRDYQLLILCLPAIIYMIIFDYGPIWGLQIAFKRFLIGKTIANAEWVGLENFIRFLEYPYFWRLLKNTLVISLFSLLIPFPMTILFALVINTSEPDFSIQMVANAFQISHTSLNELFRSEFDRTPSSLINDLRMKRAKLLLRTTRMPLKQIVQAVGYRDTSNFIRKFREAENETPGMFRKIRSGI